jgi:hypothetical protein
MKKPKEDAGVCPAEIARLCANYSQSCSDHARTSRVVEAYKTALDAACGKLQVRFKRALAAALRGSGANVRRALVFACIHHAHHPVTIQPVASCQVWVRHGLELHLRFPASVESIAAEAAKLKAIIKLNS